MIERTLQCVDFPEKKFDNSCAAHQASNKDFCTAEKADILFKCPQTCGFCAKEDGKYCEDFYLNKCKFEYFLFIVLQRHVIFPSVFGCKVIICLLCAQYRCEMGCRRSLL